MQPSQPNYLERMKSTRDAAAQRQQADQYAKREDVDEMIRHLKELQLAQLMSAQNSQNNRPMNITDSAAYVGDSIAKLEAQIMERLSDDTADKATKAELASLKSALSEQRSDMSRLTSLIATVQDTLNQLEVNPMVNVEPPKVNVTTPSVNFQPVISALREMHNDSQSVSLTPASTKFDLDSYRAQDITEHDDDTQYVGFVNPDGDWYIIENKIKANKMRYVFGSGSYSKAFKEASTYKYQLLDKAIKRATT